MQNRRIFSSVQRMNRKLNDSMIGKIFKNMQNASDVSVFGLATNVNVNNGRRNRRRWATYWIVR